MAKKIAVIGTGYVGLPLAIMLARSGYEVIGVDIEVNIAKAINSQAKWFLAGWQKQWQSF